MVKNLNCRKIFVEEEEKEIIDYDMRVACSTSCSRILQYGLQCNGCENKIFKGKKEHVILKDNLDTNKFPWLKGKQNFCSEECLNKLMKKNSSLNEEKLIEEIIEENNPNQASNGNPNSFNWTPLLITGLVLAVIGIGVWLFMKNKKKISII